MVIAKSKSKVRTANRLEQYPDSSVTVGFSAISTRFMREVNPGRRPVGVAKSNEPSTTAFSPNDRRVLAESREAGLERRTASRCSSRVTTSNRSGPDIVRAENILTDALVIRPLRPPYLKYVPAGTPERTGKLVMAPDTETDHRVKMVIRFIEENGDRQLSLNEIARSINVSPWHLCRLFRTGTGTSVNQYLLNLRMEKAKELLATTCLRVKEIMNQVGIRDESHFARTFKKLFGVSPSQYRVLSRTQPSAAMLAPTTPSVNQMGTLQTWAQTGTHS